MTAVMTEIISLLTSGLASYATAFGGALSGMVTSIFLTGSGDSQSLSAFGGIIVIFAGLSLAIGLTRWVVGWVSSLGARN